MFDEVHMGFFALFLKILDMPQSCGVLTRLYTDYGTRLFSPLEYVFVVSHLCDQITFFPLHTKGKSDLITDTTKFSQLFKVLESG